LTLEWEKLRSVDNSGLDYLQVTLARDDGVPVQVFQVELYLSKYPVSQWEPGRRLPMRVDFVAPEQAGEYTLRVGWVDGQGHGVLARCTWMGAWSYQCPVAGLRVEGTRREAGINFADQVCWCARRSKRITCD